MLGCEPPSPNYKVKGQSKGFYYRVGGSKVPYQEAVASCEVNIYLQYNELQMTSKVI